MYHSKARTQIKDLERKLSRSELKTLKGGVGSVNPGGYPGSVRMGPSRPPFSY